MSILIEKTENLEVVGSPNLEGAAVPKRISFKAANLDGVLAIKVTDADENVRPNVKKMGHAVINLKKETVNIETQVAALSESLWPAADDSADPDFLDIGFPGGRKITVEVTISGGDLDCVLYFKGYTQQTGYHSATVTGSGQASFSWIAEIFPSGLI